MDKNNFDLSSNPTGNECFDQMDSEDIFISKHETKVPEMESEIISKEGTENERDSMNENISNKNDVDSTVVDNTEAVDRNVFLENVNDLEESVDEDGETENKNGDAPVEKNKNVNRLTRLPIARVKNIMKFDDEVQYATQEAIFLVTKATELFIDNFVKEVYQCTLASKKKTISKKDVDSAIYNQDCFIFLDGALD